MYKQKYHCAAGEVRPTDDESSQAPVPYAPPLPPKWRSEHQANGLAQLELESREGQVEAGHWMWQERENQLNMHGIQQSKRGANT
jgi:hypothetical protein